MNKKYRLAGKRVWVAGHNGMVGSAILRRLESEDVAEILTVERNEVDLVNQSQVDGWLQETKPDAIFLAAARVGGIVANDTYPAEFLYQNSMIAHNVVHAAYKAQTEKLVFLGSSCVYPKFAEQPIREASLLTGSLEPTNQWYAIAKISGIMICQAYRKQYGCDFVSAMPTNLYGPGDNYHLENSHVIPALIKKAHIAKTNGAESMEIWGSGRVKREFMHADDCADGIVYIMKNISRAEHVNVGAGIDITIEDLAQKVMSTVGFEGALTKDTNKPDGTPRKIMDDSVLKDMGWTPSITLDSGLRDAYSWFLKHLDSLREK